MHTFNPWCDVCYLSGSVQQVINYLYIIVFPLQPLTSATMQQCTCNNILCVLLVGYQNVWKVKAFNYKSEISFSLYPPDSPYY